MIKFLRRFRKNLLSAGKNGEYFKYAIGEIVLVVLGILIALAINDWNEGRINNTKEQDYLIALKNDLEKQILAFNEAAPVYSLISEEGESILVDFSSTGNLLEIDSLNKRMSVLMYTAKYPEINTTFNELNSTGQLNLIRNKSLRSQVIEYYQNSKSYQDLVDDVTQDVIYNQLFPKLQSTVIIQLENFGFENDQISLGSKLQASFEDNLNDSNKEFELINAISLRIIAAKINKAHIVNAKAEAALLLAHINSELKLN